MLVACANAAATVRLVKLEGCASRAVMKPVGTVILQSDEGAREETRTLKTTAALGVPPCDVDILKTVLPHPAVETSVVADSLKLNKGRTSVMLSFSSRGVLHAKLNDTAEAVEEVGLYTVRADEVKIGETIDVECWTTVGKISPA